MTSTVVSMPSSKGGKLTHMALAKIAPPSILGMYAYAAAAFVISARWVHWYGDAQSAAVLFPLVLIFGGLAQFYAGTRSFRTRDAVSVAMHCTWGSFFTAFGILENLYATGRVVRPQGSFPELGFWFIAMAAITWSITLAARERPGMMTVAGLLASAFTLGAIAALEGSGVLQIWAGYFLMASALVAWYVATDLMRRFGRIEVTEQVVPKAPSESVRAA
jgi:uncharacterized protein